MLCAKYDYKMDIAVKQEEAYEKGVQKKAIEAAKKMLVKNYPFSDICEITDLSQKQVKELYDELHKE